MKKMSFKSVYQVTATRVRNEGLKTTALRALSESTGVRHKGKINLMQHLHPVIIGDDFYHIYFVPKGDLGRVLTSQFKNKPG